MAAAAWSPRARENLPTATATAIALTATAARSTPRTTRTTAARATESPARPTTAPPTARAAAARFAAATRATVTVTSTSRTAARPSCRRHSPATEPGALPELVHEWLHVGVVDGRQVLHELGVERAPLTSFDVLLYLIGAACTRNRTSDGGKRSDEAQRQLGHRHVLRQDRAQLFD